MIASLHKLLIAFTVVAGSIYAYGEDIILRTAPSEDATIIAKIEANAPAILRAQPVPETQKAKQGWRWFQYNTSIDGYVLTKQLSKNFRPKPNTVVRAKPDLQAHTLTLIQPTDQFKVISNNEKWTRISHHKTISAYFIEYKAIKTAAPIEASIKNYQKQIDPNKNVSHLAPENLKPENVIWSKATASSSQNRKIPTPPENIIVTPPENIIVSAPQIHVPEISPAPKIEANSPVNNITGILVREINHTSPRYPIRLKSTSGQFIAYVDMSHISINDLRPYIDNIVQIIGVIEPLASDDSDRVIQARTIRVVK